MNFFRQQDVLVLCKVRARLEGVTFDKESRIAMGSEGERKETYSTVIAVGVTPRSVKARCAVLVVIQIHLAQAGAI